MTLRPAPWIAFALWLAAMALLVPVSHDEDQYVSAAALAGRGLRPFADFLYLQTPLQLMLTGPVAAATPGWTFIALRLVNAALGLATLALVYAAQRRWSVERRTALWCCVLLAASVPFAFGSAVARNDALPAALLALALWATAGDRGLASSRLGLAGFSLSLAASAKISFALPLAGGGFWLVWRALRGGGWRGVLAWGSGGVAGLIPVMLGWGAAPEAFRYGVFTFAGEAGFDWYRLNGLAARLTLAAKAIDALWILAQGPALAALAVLAWLGWRRRFGLVEALIVGGLIGALLPTPTYKQYFICVLPPLYVALGVASGHLPRAARWTLGAFAALAIAGLAFAGVRDWRREGAPAALAVTATAHRVGATTRAAGVTGEIATLSPLRVIDSGLPLDRRFATGVFVYRSARLRTAAELERWHAVGPQTLAAAFDQSPPALLLTGYEGPSAVNRRIFPDATLEDWARAHRYRQEPMPDGRGTLWLRPRWLFHLTD